MNGLVQMTCPVCEDRYYGEYCPECACRETEARGVRPGTGEKLVDYVRRTNIEEGMLQAIEHVLIDNDDVCRAYESKGVSREDVKRVFAMARLVPELFLLLTRKAG